MAEIDSIDCSRDPYDFVDHTSEKFATYDGRRVSGIFYQSLLQNTTRMHETSWQPRIAAKISGEINAGVDIQWGGEKGIEVSGHARGEVRDDNGNYGRIDVTQNSDGSGQASISGGHKEE